MSPGGDQSAVEAKAAWRALRAATVARYAPANIFDRSFVGGKLRFDPMFRGLISGTDWPAQLHLLDLGCGRGILLALLAEARALRDAGRWPDAWPPLPDIRSMRGVDLPGPSLDRARAALGSDATVIAESLESFDPAGSNVIVLSDVLHYLDRSAQAAVLRRACEAISAGGLLLVREMDAAGGARSWITRGAERARAIGRGRPFTRFAYRSTSDWGALLRSEGLQVRTRPLDAGTPFANGLIQARTGSGGACAPADAGF